MPVSRVVMLDNFDSFTFNVLHGLVEAGAQVEVRRADAIDLPGLIALDPQLLVISPGPKRPEDAHLSLEALWHFGGRVPVLGICLGMQCMAVAFGGKVERAPEPVHGKVSRVVHDGQGIFEGLLFGLFLALVFSIVVGCVSKARCSYGFGVVILIFVAVAALVWRRAHVGAHRRQARCQQRRVADQGRQPGHAATQPATEPGQQQPQWIE